VEVVADKGYESRPDIEACMMNSIIPNVVLNMIRLKYSTI